MRRREFIAGLSGTCVWPLAGYAQHLELRRVGVLVGGAEKDPEQVSRLAAFQRSLRDFGWIEVQLQNRHSVYARRRKPHPNDCQGVN